MGWEGSGEEWKNYTQDFESASFSLSDFLPIDPVVGAIRIETEEKVLTSNKDFKFPKRAKKEEAKKEAAESMARWKLVKRELADKHLSLLLQGVQLPDGTGYFGLKRKEGFEEFRGRRNGGGDDESESEKELSSEDEE